MIDCTVTQTSDHCGNHRAASSCASQHGLESTDIKALLCGGGYSTASRINYKWMENSPRHAGVWGTMGVWRCPGSAS